MRTAHQKTDRVKTGKSQHNGSDLQHYNQLGTQILCKMETHRSKQN